MNEQEAIKCIEKFSEYPGTYPCAIVRTPSAIEVIKSIDEPRITDEQAWNKIAEAYPETVQSLRSTLDHAVFGTSKTLKRLQELESDWSQIYDSEKSFDEWVEDQVYGSKAEPQKVKARKIPQIVAKYLELCKTDNFDFTEDYNLVSYDFINHFDTDLTIEEMEEIKMWFYDNDQKENQRRHILFLQAYTYGYEVEEEPKYRVNIGGLYLKEPLGDTNDFTINMTWNENYAYSFDSWNMAREHTSKLGGEIEKV